MVACKLLEITRIASNGNQEDLIWNICWKKVGGRYKCAIKKMQEKYINYDNNNLMFKVQFIIVRYLCKKGSLGIAPTRN